MGMSGLLAGLAGNSVAGPAGADHHRFQPSATGFTAIIVAFLGGCIRLGILLAGGLMAPDLISAVNYSPKQFGPARRRHSVFSGECAVLPAPPLIFSPINRLRLGRRSR